MRPSGSTKWRKEGFIKLEDVIASNKTILDVTEILIYN